MVAKVALDSIYSASRPPAVCNEDAATQILYDHFKLKGCSLSLSNYYCNLTHDKIAETLVGKKLQPGGSEAVLSYRSYILVYVELKDNFLTI